MGGRENLPSRSFLWHLASPPCPAELGPRLHLRGGRAAPAGWGHRGEGRARSAEATELSRTQSQPGTPGSWQSSVICCRRRVAGRSGRWKRGQRRDSAGSGAGIATAGRTERPAPEEAFTLCQGWDGNRGAARSGILEGAALQSDLRGRCRPASQRDSGCRNSGAGGLRARRLETCVGRGKAG